MTFKLKIKKNYFISFLFLFFLLKPVGIDAFSATINTLMNICKLTVMITMSYQLLKKILYRTRINISIKIMLAIEFLTIICCVNNRVSPYSAIVFWHSIITGMLIAETFRKERIFEFIDILKNVLLLYVFIDIISIIIWKNGFQNTRLFILGNKNMHILYILPLLILTLIQSEIKSKNKYSFQNLFIWGISLFIIGYTASSTSIVAIALLFIFYIMIYETSLMKWFNNLQTQMVLFIIIGFGLNLVITGKSEIIKYIVTKILNKELTLTGRIYIWPRAIKMIIDRPLGYGWDALVTDVSSGDFNYWMGETVSVGHAHNLFLTIAYKSGVIAVLLLFLYIIDLSLKLNSNNMNSTTKNILKIFLYIFMIISIVDAYPTNCIGLYLICYLITRLFEKGHSIKVRKKYEYTNNWF